MAKKSLFKKPVKELYGNDLYIHLADLQAQDIDTAKLARRVAAVYNEIARRMELENASPNE